MAKAVIVRLLSPPGDFVPGIRRVIRALPYGMPNRLIG
jgi:hypothetical protein